MRELLREAWGGALGGSRPGALTLQGDGVGEHSPAAPAAWGEGRDQGVRPEWADGREKGEEVEVRARLQR